RDWSADVCSSDLSPWCRCCCCSWWSAASWSTASCRVRSRGERTPLELSSEGSGDDRELAPARLSGHHGSLRINGIQEGGAGWDGPMNSRRAGEPDGARPWRTWLAWPGAPGPPSPGGCGETGRSDETRA